MNKLLLAAAISAIVSSAAFAAPVITITGATSASTATQAVVNGGLGTSVQSATVSATNTGNAGQAPTIISLLPGFGLNQLQAGAADSGTVVTNASGVVTGVGTGSATAVGNQAGSANITNVQVVPSLGTVTVNPRASVSAQGVAQSVNTGAASQVASTNAAQLVQGSVTVPVFAQPLIANAHILPASTATSSITGTANLSAIATSTIGSFPIPSVTAGF